MITRRAVLLLLLGAALLQAAWILAMPPFRGADEFDHAYRAAAVARGEWRAGAVATNGRGQYVEVPDALVRAAHDQCAALRYTGADNCTGLPGSRPGLTRSRTGSGSYNPVYYWIVGTVGRCCDGATSLYAMGVASALLCDLFLVIAAFALRQVGHHTVAVARASRRNHAGSRSTPRASRHPTAWRCPRRSGSGAACSDWAKPVVPRPIDGSCGRDPVRAVLGTVRLLGPAFTFAIV